MVEAAQGMNLHRQRLSPLGTGAEWKLDLGDDVYLMDVA